MQIKDYPSTPNWALVDEPKGHQVVNGFRSGLGFAPSSIDEDETVSGSLDYDSEPEELEEKDRVGEDTRPRK
ncbi:MAG TPA: hypothetical protein VK780_08075 [Thermoanaerobaculia bacterium]|nr:hypothetical protein [Thermoanaerobaculia bacterium]